MSDIRVLEAQLNKINLSPNPDPKIKLRALNDLAFALIKLEPQKVEQLLQEIKPLLNTLYYPQEQAEFDLLQAELLFSKGSYQQALRKQNQAETIILQLQVPKLQVASYALKGKIQWRLGNLVQALDAQQQTLQLARNLGDVRNEVYSLNAIAVIYANSGDYVTADNKFKQAMNLCYVSNDANIQPLILNNWAMNLQMMEQYPQALDKCMQALTSLSNGGYPRYKVHIFGTIGRIYNAQNNYTQSLHYYKKGIQLADKLSVVSAQGILRMRMGQVHLELENNELALTTFREAMQRLVAKEQKLNVAECHKLLAEVHERLGNLDRALYHFKEFHKKNASQETEIAKVRQIKLKQALKEQLQGQQHFLLAQKNETMGKLASGIAHDFNNTLASIMLYGDVIQAKLSNQHPAYRDISKLLTITEYSRKLTDQLLSYASTQDVSLQSIDLNKLLLENESLFRLILPSSISLKMSLGKNLLPIQANNVQLCQLIINLVRNGAEAHHNQQGTVIIKTSMATMDIKHPEQQWHDNWWPISGNYLLLSIEDSGQGMDKEQAEQLFTSIYTTKQTGYGIGLVAVSNIVRLHGGGIKVESKVGGGTKFQIGFPILEDIAP